MASLLTVGEVWDERFLPGGHRTHCAPPVGTYIPALLNVHKLVTNLHYLNTTTSHTRITRIASGGLRIDDAQCGTRHATVRRRVVIRPVRLQRAAADTLLPRRGVLYGPSLTQYTRSCRAISVCVCYIARRATPVGTHSQVPRRAIVAAFDVSTRRARHGDEIGGRFGRTRHTPTWQRQLVRKYTTSIRTRMHA